LHVLILVGLVSSAGAEIEWVIETPDGPRQFGHRSDRILALDPLGRPHIAYGEDGLFHAWHDGAEWRIETVDTAYDVGLSAAIAIDAFGRPHIGYYDNENDDLKYAHLAQSGWYVETVESDGSVGWSVSIAVDAEGRPYISYADQTNRTLRYAFQDNDYWVFETPDTTGDSGAFTSLALDRTGYPHISYVAYGTGEIKYAFADDSGWHVATVDTFQTHWEFPAYTSLCLGREDDPHISFSCPVTCEVRYARMVQGEWSTEFTDNGSSVSIALDPTGYPIIAYYSGIEGWYWGEPLCLAQLDVSGWNISVVDSAGWRPSLAVDWNGKASICYQTDWELRFTREDEAAWTSEMVDREGRVGGYTSIALDTSGLPHISYYDYQNLDLKYSHRNPSGWLSETVDSEGYVGWYTSIALDETSSPHIGYQQWWDGYIKYAHWVETRWVIEIADTVEYNQPTGLSIALDHEGVPHLSYHWEVASSTGRAMYARRENSGWSTELAGQGGSHTSIAVDNGGSPRICHRSPRGLEYAVRTSSSWVHEVIDSVNGAWPSLTLDTDGFPHVSYGEFVEDAVLDLNLRYAFRDRNGWHIEVVDSAGRSGYYTSIALDSRGFPHISYQERGEMDLKYAFQDEAGWHVMIVVSDGDVGAYSSIALDSNDNPYISYSDASRDDLKMARGSGSVSAGGFYRPLEYSPIRLIKIWPNPLRTRALFQYTIGYDLPDLSIRVYDLSGRAVVTLSDQTTMRGTYCAEWDLLDFRGEPVPAGSYLLTISGVNSDQKTAARLVVLR
jgi:hypothetical protein